MEKEYEPNWKSNKCPTPEEAMIRCLKVLDEKGLGQFYWHGIEFIFKGKKKNEKDTVKKDR